MVFPHRKKKGAKECKSCRSRRVLQNAYLPARIGVDTAENEPSEVSPKGRVQSGSFRGRGPPAMRRAVGAVQRADAARDEARADGIHFASGNDELDEFIRHFLTNFGRILTNLQRIISESLTNLRRFSTTFGNILTKRESP